MIFFKKAQSWIFEYIVSFLIFLTMLFITLNILNSISSSSNFEDVLEDADHISSLFLSSGLPDNWQATSVQTIGLTSNGRIDLDKINEFDSMNYASAKSLLGISNEFIFYFEDVSGLIVVDGSCYRGFMNGCDDFKTLIKYDDLAITKRIVVLNSNIVELVVVVWR